MACIKYIDPYLQPLHLLSQVGNLERTHKVQNERRGLRGEKKTEKLRHRKRNSGEQGFLCPKGRLPILVPFGINTNAIIIFWGTLVQSGSPGAKHTQVGVAEGVEPEHQRVPSEVPQGSLVGAAPGLDGVVWGGGVIPPAAQTPEGCCLDLAFQGWSSEEPRHCQSEKKIIGKKCSQRWTSKLSKQKPTILLRSSCFAYCTIETRQNHSHVNIHTT